VVPILLLEETDPAAEEGEHERDHSAQHSTHSLTPQRSDIAVTAAASTSLPRSPSIPQSVVTLPSTLNDHHCTTVTTTATHITASATHNEADALLQFLGEHERVSPLHPPSHPPHLRAQSPHTNESRPSAAAHRTYAHTATTATTARRMPNAARMRLAGARVKRSVRGVSSKAVHSAQRVLAATHLRPGYERVGDEPQSTSIEMQPLAPSSSSSFARLRELNRREVCTDSAQEGAQDSERRERVHLAGGKRSADEEQQKKQQGVVQSREESGVQSREESVEFAEFAEATRRGRMTVPGAVNVRRRRSYRLRSDGEEEEVDGYVFEEVVTVPHVVAAPQPSRRERFTVYFMVLVMFLSSASYSLTLPSMYSRLHNEMGVENEAVFGLAGRCPACFAAHLLTHAHAHSLSLSRSRS
jgi:hypothetical protein